LLPGQHRADRWPNELRAGLHGRTKGHEFH
jgi:hypothetical protein